MTTELRAFAHKLSMLTRPEDLFGPLTTLRALQRLYHQFARIAHTDRYTDAADQRVAHEAFTRLTALHDEAQQRLKAGIYGTDAATNPTTIRHKQTTYTLRVQQMPGDLSVLYHAHASGAVTGEVWLKVARSARDNDLLRQEVTALRALQQAAAKLSFHHYLPTILDSFQIAGRQTNVLAPQPGFIPVIQLLRKFPDGLDPRHFVWIFNRLLSILGFVHGENLVHGAVLPTHLLINPSNHGLVLVDWCWSVPMDRPLKAISEASRDLYAPEVLAKQPVGAATDIYMGALTMMLLLGGVNGRIDDHLPQTVPPAFRRFLDACTLPARARRPADAWVLLDEFKETAKAVYGPPRYVTLEV